jgi:hypothetical protein
MAEPCERILRNRTSNANESLVEKSNRLRTEMKPLRSARTAYVTPGTASSLIRHAKLSTHLYYACLHFFGLHMTFSSNTRSSLFSHVKKYEF